MLGFLALVLALSAALDPALRAPMYVAVSFVVGVALWLQPIEMMMKRSAEKVSVRFARNFTIVTAVWTLYGVAIGDILIACASGAFMLSYGSMWYLSHRFREVDM